MELLTQRNPYRLIVSLQVTHRPYLFHPNSNKGRYIQVQLRTFESIRRKGWVIPVKDLPNDTTEYRFNHEEFEP